MSVWRGLVGQDDAVRVLQKAAESELIGSHDDSDGMTHAWLVTGPAGSGRSNLAFAFAAALLSRGPADIEFTTAQVKARTHPDLGTLTSEKVIISIEDVRSLVTSSHFSPSVGRYRVMVIEDADRMPERTSNVLLKALEEPPARTVWILCAPSEADVIPTIRSRVRSVRLRVPAVNDVARLLVETHGIDAETAERSARQAQSHIGMARRLATNEEARQRREQTLSRVFGIRGVADAMQVARQLSDIAVEDSKAVSAERDEREREETLRNLGVTPGAAIPPALRSQVRQLEEDQKRRATRSVRDGVDRIFTDLLSAYRDVLVIQLGGKQELINREFNTEIRSAAQRMRPDDVLVFIEEIAIAQKRISSNVTPLLSLEALLCSLVH
ncbi:DNA polymerase III subunit delta' [Lysinibacter sp. HNR]|uniref:DNA polymerase III subunit delta' n=1 Tax=Lysinibacter sp. HNR TaxID=3031408 RepID=UPI0024350731|nr:DNA polymerase III subunit delta' [Lysinibacter sp. HNR]WGD37074.1 DNA polymerase III subunit delta' [Lysinibacter sp. HNR]